MNWIELSDSNTTAMLRLLLDGSALEVIATIAVASVIEKVRSAITISPVTQPVVAVAIATATQVNVSEVAIAVSISTDDNHSCKKA